MPNRERQRAGDKTRQIGNGNEVAGVKVGKFRERVHNFASTDQMEATNSPK